MQQNPPEINWLAIVAPSLIIGFGAIVAQVLLAFWLTKVSERIKTSLSKEIEDYKKDIGKELEDHRAVRQEETDRKRLLLSKIEKIYELGSEYMRSYDVLTVRLISKSIHPSIDLADGQSKVPRSELHMLIDLYAPSLEAKGSVLEAAVKEYEKAMVEIVSSKPDESIRKQLRGNLVLRAQVITAAGKELLAETVKLSKNYL